MDNVPAIRAEAAPRSGSKLLGLEIVRFACAVIVLIWHFQHFAMIGDGSGMNRAHEPLSFLLWPIYKYGSFGVHIFWGISGFIFYWKYADAIAARTVEAKRFFWLRFSRLYPLHFVTLLTVAALQPVYATLNGDSFVYHNSVTSFLLQLGLADQWAGARALSFNGPIWSVSAEVSVYVAFFLLLRIFGRSPVVIVSAILLGLLAIWSGGSSAPLVCAGFFFAGGAAADWLQSERARNRPSEARWIAVAMIVAIVAFVAAFVELAPNKAATPSLLLALCPPSLFLLAQDMPLLDRWQGPIQAAGNLTYSTYLIHFPMQLGFGVIALATGMAIPIAETWFLLAYLAAALVIGRIVFLRFEAPVQDLIRAATLTRSGARAAA